MSQKQPTENMAQEFIFSVFEEAFCFISPFLSNHQEFSETLSEEVKTKTGSNVQYNFDIELDEIFKKQIEKHEISGKIFSEESGFFEWGEKKFKVVFDPFCNSTLASRTFRDAAAGISLFSFDGRFIASAILDYQTGILGMANDIETKFFQIQNKEEIAFDYAPVTDISEAWIAITLENQKERGHLEKARNILGKAKRILIGSGHAYWLRLAIGAIDAYLDPFGGEPLYEMFACAVAQKNGCIVSGIDGEEFNPEKYLRKFEEDQKLKFYPVAARNEILHKQVLESLHGSKK